MKPTQCAARCALVVGLRSWWLMKQVSGRNLPGLGFMLRRLWFSYPFVAGGRTFWLDHRNAAAYCLLPAGLWNEPETHVFMRTVFAYGRWTFIDVGASIGEMAIDAAGYASVREVHAFEPQPLAARAIARSAELNGFGHLRVTEAAVSAAPGEVCFEANAHSPTAAHIGAERSAQPSLRVRCTTLDQELASTAPDGQCLLLIDVEGHEVEVLKGGAAFIARARPLIIFEYNDTSRRCFSLEEVRAVLGDGWRIYRLRPNGDGRLDDDLSDTYNCVAVPDGPLESVVRAASYNAGECSH